MIPSGSLARSVSSKPRQDVTHRAQMVRFLPLLRFTFEGALRSSRGAADPIFGRKLPVLFERCGLENIRHEATAEVVRGRSPRAPCALARLEMRDDVEKHSH